MVRTAVVRFVDGEIQEYPNIDRVIMDNNTNELVLVAASIGEGQSRTIPRERIKEYWTKD
jgi:hypothetical protein